MEGKIQVNSGDISIADIKVDGTSKDTIPAKTDGKSFQKADCDNNAIGDWDNTNWQFLLSNFTKTKTKCTLYFVTGTTPSEQSSESKLKDLLEENKNLATPTLVSDEYNNIRYIGARPNNWVTFNGEKWRIIGLMDGIQTKNNGTQRLLKIIRNDSLGDYSWDSSASEVNNGGGVNEWSQADIQKVLNNNYLTRATGGTCYGDYRESIKACPDWTNVGLDTTAQNMVEEVVWNTGTTNGTEQEWRYYDYTPQQYMWERSSYNGKRCSGGSSCNDLVGRTTEWTGKVGLMYPSDYGYATDGGGDLKRKGNCLYTPLYSWDGSSYSYCKTNDWLLASSNYQWTMTPAPYSSLAAGVFVVRTSGYVDHISADHAGAIRPVVYLKSNVKISKGEGTISSPYALTITS